MGSGTRLHVRCNLQRALVVETGEGMKSSSTVGEKHSRLPQTEWQDLKMHSFWFWFLFSPFEKWAHTGQRSNTWRNWKDPKIQETLGLIGVPWRGVCFWWVYGGRSRRVKVKTSSWTLASHGHLVSLEGRHLYSFSSSPWVETSKTGKIL